MPGALLEALAAAILWGSLGVAYRLGLANGADPSWMIAGRPLAASILSLASLAAGERPSRWSAAVGLLGLAPLYVSYFLAVQEVGAAVASLLLYTAPVWVALLSPLAGDPLEPGRLGQAGLGLLGAALLLEPWRGRYTLHGALLGLASGASYAAYILLARLAQRRGASPWEVSIHAFPFAAAGVLALIRPRHAPTAVDLVFAGYLAVLGTIVPYLLNARALARLEAPRVAVVSLVEPLTAVLLSAILLGEMLDPVQALGAVLVASSALLAALRGRRG